MITFVKKTHIKGDSLVLQLPTELPEDDYEVVVVMQLQKENPARKAGFIKGRFVMVDDFNAPLEDLKSYLE